ncbi:MAG: S1 RNA-binding domain-containing protein, partial [Oscillospiraceae bacterium]
MVEIGAILEGKVTGLTNFGAFVSLPENATGMVHISEVASTYVS